MGDTIRCKSRGGIEAISSLFQRLAVEFHVSVCWFCIFLLLKSIRLICSLVELILRWKFLNLIDRQLRRDDLFKKVCRDDKIE